MTVPGDVLLIVVGVLLAAGSRTVADALSVRPQRSAFRWIAAVLTGLTFVGIGGYDLLSR